MLGEPQSDHNVIMVSYITSTWLNYHVLTAHYILLKPYIKETKYAV